VRDQANIHGNVLRSLEGSAAGLNVTETADGVTYLIRGVSSINSKKEPLFIVDGVAMTREQMDKMVNPNDVESVNFLKDATAASIWGAQAANGVIVVTTRKGSAGDLRISYNGSFTYKGKPDWKYLDMMTSEQFINTAVEVFDPQTYKWSDVQNNTYGIGNDYRVVYPHEDALYRYYLGEISLDERDARLNALKAVNGRKEYEKYFMSNAFLMNHSVSFSGGTEKNSFYVSIENQRDRGTNKDTSDEYRLFFRDALKLTPWMDLDISANLFYSGEQSYLKSYDMRSDLPYMSYYDKDGNELSLTNYIMTDAYRESIEGITGIGLKYYPVSDFLSNPSNSKTLGANANAGLTIRFAPGLSYEGRFQYSLTQGTSESYLSPTSFGVRLERAQGTDSAGKQYLPSSGGHYTFASSSMSSYTVRNQINLDTTLGKDNIHRVTGVAGMEISSRKSGSNSLFMRGYDIQTMEYIFYDDYNLSQTGVKNPALPSFAASSTNTFDPNQYGQTEMEYRFVSMYANGAYTLKDKYSFNASVRVDQSNLFGSDPSVQFKPIWSTGFIWNMSREDFMKSTSRWLNRLNLRASFGYAGNSPDPGQGGPYNILSSVSSANYSRFGLGYVVVTPANDKLSWEKTQIVNLGVDWAVLGHRVSGEIDVYHKNTTNMLGQAPVDPTTGFTTVLSNIGSMTNDGIEFTVNSTNITAGDFEWTTDFNITYNKNKLVDMYVEHPKSAYAMVTFDYWKGYPYGTVFAYKWAGLDPADGMPRAYDSAGNIIRSITDIDTEDAVKYAGTTVPPVFGSLNNDFRWKNWDLSVSFIYNLGHVLRNDVNTTFSYRLERNLHNDFSERWKNPGDEAKTNVPAYYSLKNTSINETDVIYLYRYADVNVLSASYIKLREVSLGYRIPEKACSAIHVKNATARLQVSNLATIAFNGEGIDPEAFSFGGSRADRFHPFVSASLNVEF
jgi:TonB-linked SusC/RagA family outer membrane protein